MDTQVEYCTGSDLVYREVITEVRELAALQDCREEEVILNLLNQALQTRRTDDRTRQAWESLSLREKQVAALVCSGLTGRQIAAQLVLSPETIKTHVRHILRKFGLKSRQELRNVLADWNLNRWLPVEGTAIPAQYSLVSREERLTLSA